MGRDSSRHRDLPGRMSAEDENDREKLLASMSWQSGLNDAQSSPLAVPPRERGHRAFLSRWRWLVDTAMLLVILGLLFERETRFRTHETRPIGSDITGFAPQFTSKITTFSPSTAYVPENMTDFFSDSVKLAWLDLVPQGLGYVDIEPLSPTARAGLHDLPTPISGYPSNQTIFTTSVTHQLHCLYSVIHSYAAAKTGVKAGGHGHGHRRRDGVDEVVRGNEEEEEEQAVDEDFHVQHCFDYLRQSIMCSGDVALEGDQTTFPEGAIGSDGWDAKHVCRDWGQVYQHLKESRANDDVWIA